MSVYILVYSGLKKIFSITIIKTLLQRFDNYDAKDFFQRRCYLPPASVGFQHSPQLFTCAMHSVHALVNMVFVVNIHIQLLTWPSCYRDINHMLKISN